MSALDIVHCANALLEYPSSVTAEMNHENVFKQGKEEGNEQIMYDRVVNREDNFWSVYHDLLNEDSSYL